MGHLIGQGAAVVQGLEALELVVVQAQVLVLALVFLESRLDLAGQDHGLAAVIGRGGLGLGAHAHVGGTHLVLHGSPFLGLHEHLIGVVGHAHDLLDDRQDAHVVQLGAGGIVGAGVALGQQQDAAVRSLRLVHSALALGAAHVNVLRDTGQDNHISQGDDGKFPDHADSLEPCPVGNG